MTEHTNKPARYVVMTGVAWKAGNGHEVNRWEGDDCSDAPPEAIKEWVALGAVRRVRPPRVTADAHEEDDDG